MSSHGDPDDKQLSLTPEGLGVRITYLASQPPAGRCGRGFPSRVGIPDQRADGCGCPKRLRLLAGLGRPAEPTAHDALVDRDDSRPYEPGGGSLELHE